MQKKNGRKATMDHGTPKRTRSETTKMTYTIEHDCTLECDICFLPFESQVYMCKNGHTACGSCCVDVNTACPFCDEPIGGIRCSPLEKVLAAMSVPCKFKANGCNEIVRYTEKRSHEASCLYGPWHCPFDGCTYQGPLLYNHIQNDHATDAVVAMDRRWGTTVTVHRSKPFKVVLDSAGTRVFLLLNGGDVVSVLSGGRSLSLVSIGPPPSPNCELLYEIAINVKAGRGELALSATDIVPYVRQLKGFKAKTFLFVPDSYWGSSGTVSVTVCVGV